MKRFRHKRWHGSPALDRQGFTLIEIAMVLVIVGLLIGVGTALLGPLIKQAKYKQSLETVKAAKEAVIGYVLKNGSLPTAAEVPAITKNVDAWNTNLFYYTDNAFTGANLCCVVNTGFQVEDRCPTGQDCGTGDPCCKTETAFVILSPGENHANETGTVPTFTILQYGTNYDDIVEYVDLSRLRQELSCSAVEIRTSNPPEGAEDTAYNAQLQGYGGCTAYAWSPAGAIGTSGLSLNAAGTISGTVNTSATPTGTLSACSNTIGLTGVTLTDAQGKTATKDLSILVYPQTLRITNSDLPSTTEGAVAASFATLNGTGGMNSYTWSLSGNPGWLTVDGVTGVLTVTNPPSGSAGDYPFTVTLSDTCSTTSKGFSVNVSAVAGGGCGSLALNPVSGTNWPATAGTAFNQSISISGGQAPYTNTVCTQSGICNGVNLTCNASGANISGTPLLAGVCAINVSWNDSCLNPAMQSVSGAYNVIVSSSSCNAFSGWFSSLPAATNCQSYSGSVTVLGGVPNYAWTISPSPILLGLTDCNGQSGASTLCSIAGTPTAAPGNYLFTASVTDSCAVPQTVSQAFTITVNSDACAAAGMQLRNGSGAARYYERNGGACTTWNNTAVLAITRGNSYVVYSENTCTTLYCGSTVVDYCQEKTVDADKDCATQMNNPCAFVDR